MKTSITKTVSTTLLRKKLKDVLAEVNDSGEPIIITQDGETAGVLFPGNSYLTKAEKEEKIREEMKFLESTLDSLWGKKTNKKLSQNELDSSTF